MGRADLSIRAQARESAPTTTDRVVYPTLGLITILIRDEEVRRAACRALNRMKAEMFAGFTDRLIPVATIPMHTPREAIDELEFAVRDLRLRAVMMASLVPRAIKEAMRISPQAARYTYWIDTFGLASEYDYDPVWAKCVELGVSPNVSFTRLRLGQPYLADELCP
jgi:predicted TIM-barrel fold metal-dependent hydrolase